MSSTLKNTRTINLSIPGATKTRVVVGEDENGKPKCIYLNLDDQDIMRRSEEALDKLNKYAEEFKKMEALEKGLGEVGDNQNIKYYEEKEKVNSAAKEVIDSIFDYPVCDACSAGGTLFDIISDDGRMRYDVILSCLTSLYKGTFEKAEKNMNEKRKQHTEGYIEA